MLSGLLLSIVFIGNKKLYNIKNLIIICYYGYCYVIFYSYFSNIYCLFEIFIFGLFYV